jgi:hypothetical protein
MAKLIEVKGQSGRGKPQPLPDTPGRQAFRAGLHQQPKHIEAGFLSERRKRGNGVYLFQISKIIEIMRMSTGGAGLSVGRD